MVIDHDAKVVTHVADGRGRECLDSFYQEHTAEEREVVSSVTMDMWGPYIESTREHIPDAETKIVSNHPNLP